MASVPSEDVSFGLAFAARGLFGAAIVARLLLRGNEGPDGAEPLVLDDRRLIDLLNLVEDAIGQVEPVVTDRQAPVRIVDDRYTLMGRGRVISFASMRKRILSY